MCTYLAKRGATYYFRRVIPVELRPAMDGRAEFMLSLKTKDRETAKKLIPGKTAATDRLLDEARAKLARGAPQSPAQRQSAHGAARERAAFEASLEAAEIAFQEGVEQEARYDAREPLRERFLAALKLSTAQITPEEAAARDVLRDIQRKLTLAEERELARKVEDAEARRGLVPQNRAEAPAPTSTGAADSGVMLTTDDDAEDIVDLWAAERKPVPKGKDTHRAVACWFYERVGRKPVKQIARADVLAFKKALIDEGTTLANTKMKLSRLRTLLQWAWENDYATENAAAGVTVKDTEQAKNKRREFDLASLNRIFASPVFAEGARPAGGKGEAAYWLPLLALFTGARLEELGQLRPGDVQEIAYPDAEGVERRSWFIRIAEDKDDNLKLKNARSERDVPVHPELERLGFLAFVKAAASAKQERLFPKLKANVYGRLTAKWGEWFGPYLRNVCGVTDKRLVFHSFRHTFKQYARLAGIVEGVQRQIMGHSPGDVADEYGSGYPTHQLVEGMRLYRVPGLKLP